MKARVWLAVSASYDTSALGTLANVTVIDRDSGAELSTYYYRGEYWIAGRPGARYAIEIRNCTDGRLLAVTSVDGVNVISGATAAWHQTGYVFDSGQRYEITGWRKSHEQVAAFFFTDISNSYAARTGRPANVGVIGLALFRERQPTVYSPRQIAPFAQEREPVAQGAAASAGPAAPLTERLAGLPATAAAAAKLGTGHGAREYSYVQDTEFVRLNTEPDEVVRVRYDSLENLVAMGVLPSPAPTPETPNPFPRSHEHGFVPDPRG
jgi:hypothetical protein